MSRNSQLTPPGSSTYASDTLHVGDGTWDLGRETFLLPNLMGLNFETMRYNGMGNRFREMAGYHPLIKAHGVIATFVFLGLVPTSIFLIRYYSRRNPFWALKLHAWCQVLTLLLSTVVFVLGWFAVGPERSLTNPHHGIGLAIYVMVIFQVLWGWFVHKREKSQRRYRIPLKVAIHRWLGRALALLGIVQIPLGLTLYGSPKVLFILFALGAFALLLLWFILSHIYDTGGHYVESEYDSRVSGPTEPTEPEEHRHGWGRWLAAGAAGIGLTEFFRRRRDRKRERERAYEDSYISYGDEKYSEDQRQHGGWGKKLLEVGALAGVAGLAKKIFDRRRNREDDAESGRYRPAHTRSDSMTEETLSRMEDGRRPEPSHHTPLNRPPSRPPSRTQSPGSSYYYDNSAYFTEEDGGGDGGGGGGHHGIRDAILGAGAFGAVKRIFSRGKGNAEQRRIDEMRRRDREDERLARANSKRQHAGPGYDPRNRRAASYNATDMSSTDMARPPREPTASGAVPPPSDVPPVPPSHHDMGAGVTGRHPSGHDTAELAGASSFDATRHQRPHSSGSRRDEHVDSPPVSVKVKMHNDGRHVTLRRLTDEEAAAGRESRRRERRGSRRRTGSAGSLSPSESYDRWRRVEDLERQQAEQIQREQNTAAAASAANHSIAQSGSAPQSSFPAQSHIGPLPPAHTPHPPPHAPSSLPYGAGSITSPGTYTGTDASGDYANNRRRRRAERARARQDRQQHGVEFT